MLLGEMLFCCKRAKAAAGRGLLQGEGAPASSLKREPAGFLWLFVLGHCWDEIIADTSHENLFVSELICHTVHSALLASATRSLGHNKRGTAAYAKGRVP